MRKIYLLFALTLVVLLNACKKDDTIGADILPNDDLLNVGFTDTFTVYSKTLSDTFLRTDKLAKNYLGVINDAKFGFQKSSIVLELDKPTTVYDDTLGPFTLDSVVLLMKYTSIYGDTLVPQNFKVSTIGNKINESSSYYSNTELFPPNSEIGSVNDYYFKSSNKVIVSGSDTVGSTNIFRVKINSSVGNSILNLGQNVLRDSMSFKNAFPGIRVENIDNSGKCMVEMDLSSTTTGIVIYYRDKNNVKREMRLLSAIPKPQNGVLLIRQNSINLFEKSLSAVVQNTINSGEVSDSVNYFLGQGGTLIKISLPTIGDFENAAINKATLVVTQILPNTTTDFSAPLVVVLLRRNSNGQLDDIPTFIANGNFGFNSSSGPPPEGVGYPDSVYIDNLGNKMIRYSISLSKYVQNIVNNTESNKDLYLAYYRSAGTDGSFNVLNSYGFSYTPVRFILAGGNYSDPRFRMKLNIIYSKIK